MTASTSARGRRGAAKRAALIVVVAAGIAARIACLPGGFPDVFYRDEDDVIESAVYTLSPDLNPHIYKYPSFLSSVSGMVFRLSLAGERLDDPAVVSAAFTGFQADPVRLTMTARAVALLLSLVAFPAVYFMARRLWGDREALLALALVALSPLHLDVSRVARVDAPCAAFTILAMWLALRYIDAPSKPRFILMGVAAGAAAAFKEPGGGVVIPIMLLIVTARPAGSHATPGPSLPSAAPAPRAAPRRFALAAAHGALALLSFVALFPFMLLEYGEFHEFLVRSKFLFTTAYWGEGQSTLAGVAAPLSRYAVGVIGSVGCAAYVVSLARRPRRASARETIAVLGFPILLCAGFVAAETFFMRFFLPALPFLCVAAGRGLSLAIEWAARRRRAIRIAAACAGAAGALWLVADSASTVHWLVAKRDPRLRAAAWIERNVSRETPIVTGLRRNSPYLFSVEEPFAHRVPTLRKILAAHAPEHLAPLDEAMRKAAERAATDGWSVHYERDTLVREAARPAAAGAVMVITFEKTKDFRKSDRDAAIARLRATHDLAAEFPGGWHGTLGAPTQVWVPKRAGAEAR